MYRISLYTGIEQLPAAHRAVFERAGRESVFLSPQWFSNFERTVLGPDERSTIYFVEEADSSRPVAALPMWRRGAVGGMFTLSKLEALANYYSTLFGPAIGECASGKGEIAEAFAAALWSERRSWDLIDLRPMDQDGDFFTALLEAFRGQGAAVQPYFCFGNWYLEVSGRSYAEYLKALPSVLRKNIPYNARRLERSGGRIEIVTGGDDIDRAIRDYEAIYGASWKRSEPYPEFMPGLIRTAAAEGWLRLGLAYVDGAPAAAQVWLVHGGVASIYKIGYDERYAKLSVGTVLTARLMERAIDGDGVRVVDYLSGDDAYKRDWMSHRRERWGILAMNTRSAKGLAHAARHLAGQAVKHRLKRWLAPMIPRSRQAAPPAA